MEILVWEDPFDKDFTKRLEVTEGEYEECDIYLRL